MNNTKLSIVIPVYNGEQYIDGLLKQLSRQADSSVELVFVDDGSTDDSYACLKKWKDSVMFPMTVYHQENKGVSAARNAGAEIAKGEYIAYVDVDDAVSEDYVAALLLWTESNQDVLVFQTARLTNLEKLAHASKSNEPTEFVTGYEMLKRFLNRPTNYGVYNLLLKREYVSAINAKFPVGYKYYEDYDYLLQVFAQTDKIAVLNEVLYYYILREGSAMGKFSADRIFCLKLMKGRELWLDRVSPQFALLFRKWGVSRLYWSVLWQAALSLRSYKEFAAFARMTYAKEYLEKMMDYPSGLVRVSTIVFLTCKPVYWAVVRMTGQAKSKVERISLSDLDDGKLRNAFYY